MLEDDLGKEKQMRFLETTDLQFKIEMWEDKYDRDVRQVKEQMTSILQFTDLERALNEQITAGFRKEIETYEK